jgi:hypothetical protein
MVNLVMLPPKATKFMFASAVIMWMYVGTAAAIVGWDDVPARNK